MNKISTRSPFAHLCPWLSPCDEFPNSYREPDTRTAWALCHTATPQPFSQCHPALHIRTHFTPTNRAWFNHTVLLGQRQYGSICAHFCCGGNQNAALPSCMCGCICVCVCVCSTGLAKRGTSVRILDIHFYCNRKHLGQMLACSEVTCGFETGHSFPISAWEPKERESIK